MAEALSDQCGKRLLNPLIFLEIADSAAELIDHLKALLLKIKEWRQ